MSKYPQAIPPCLYSDESEEDDYINEPGTAGARNRNQKIIEINKLVKKHRKRQKTGISYCFF